MSTPAHPDSEISSQTVGAQSSRVPTPLHDDPYVTVRQANLVDTDTESNPEEALSETEDESSDSDAEREGHGLDDEGHGLDDEGHGLDEEGQGLEDEGPSSEEEEEEVAPDGLGEGLMPNTFEVGQSSRVYTDILTYVPPFATVQTPPSFEWASGSFPVSLSSIVVSSPIVLPATTPIATISRENHDLRRQIAEERRERLELIDRVARWRGDMSLEGSSILYEILG
ncbi:hypothetical protein Tco_0195337 [Tanacetum coccineum]